jgi:hypothetical protein
MLNLFSSVYGRIARNLTFMIGLWCKLTIENSTLVTPLSFVAAGTLGCALIDCSSYFLFLNQITFREAAFVPRPSVSWLGIAEHVSDVFCAAIGLPFSTRIPPFIDKGFIEHFLAVQPSTHVVTLLRVALLSVSCVALLRLFPLRRLILAPLLKWTRIAVSITLLSATVWLARWHIPVGEAIRGATATLYLVVVLSLVTLAISILTLGKQPSIFAVLSSPRIGVAASALAATYLVLKCATKLPIHRPFMSSELIAGFVQAIHWTAVWAAVGVATSIACSRADGRLRFWTPRSFIECLGACGALLIAHPLASDARLNLGMPPAWSRVGSPERCAPLRSDALAIEPEPSQPLSKDYLYLIRGKSLALYVPLDAVLEAYSPALCGLCNWDQDLFIVVDQVKWIESRTLGNIPTLDYTCSSALRLNCELDGDERIARLTFRSLLSTTPSNVLPMGKLCSSVVEAGRSQIRPSPSSDKK